MDAKRIIDGSPGDKYQLPEAYEGCWENAVGTPVSDNVAGESVPVPDGTSGSDLTVVERPDFRSASKRDPVFDD
jgi:hypothetical protein